MEKELLWCALYQGLPLDERRRQSYEACLLFVYAKDIQSVRKRKRESVHQRVYVCLRNSVCERQKD